MRFSEKLAAWMARAELMARGAEPLRQQAQSELVQGRPWRARELSLRILYELPGSPIALAIWADAAEAMLLDDESFEALTRLSALLPYRADVWTRLAEVQRRRGASATASLERALAAGEPVDAALDAARHLLERALDARELPRALELAGKLRASSPLTPVLRFRLAEAALASGSQAEARRLVAGGIRPELTDVRGWLTLGRLWLELRDPRAPVAFRRALILGSAAEQQAVGEVLLRSPERSILRELWPLVEQLGLVERSEWQLARALVEPEPARALAQLEETALEAPTLAALGVWLDAVLWARDAAALTRALRAAQAIGMRERDHENLASALALAQALALSDRERLAALDRMGGAGAAWAHELRIEAYADWLERGTERGWQLAFDEAEALARGSLDLAALTGLSSLRLDLERPLRVAVIGEFNAGKSTLINALVGEAVLPVGVLPTTATVNRLRWAPERSVRVEFTDRTRAALVLEYSALRSYLKQADAASISSVSMFAPLEALRELEIIDTPGFNADREGHGEAARSAARSAHVLLWVLDASLPLKESDARQLESLRELPLPTCVVLNKTDRLDEGELVEVLEHVREGLARLGLVPILGPLGLSATRAEQARAGNLCSPARSALDDLTGLVEALRARSVELKAWVLRQRMQALVGDLETRLLQQQAGEGETPRAALSAAVRRLEARAQAERAEWAAELGPVLGELEREVGVVLGSDDHASRYRAERVRAVVGERLLELARLSLGDTGAWDLLGDTLRGRLSALVSGTSLAHEPEVTRTDYARLARQTASLAHTETLKVCQEALRARWVVPGETHELSSDSEAQRRRLVALRAALAKARRAP